MENKIYGHNYNFAGDNLKPDHADGTARRCLLGRKCRRSGEKL